MRRFAPTDMTLPIGSRAFCPRSGCARSLGCQGGALKPLDGRPPFRQVRELVRRVPADCAIEVDGNSYRVPWRLIGESVQVMVADGRVRVHHGNAEVAVHAETTRRRQRVLDPAQFCGVVGLARPCAAHPAAVAPPQPALLRQLAEYERIVGGGWS